MSGEPFLVEGASQEGGFSAFGLFWLIRRTNFGIGSGKFWAHKRRIGRRLEEKHPCLLIFSQELQANQARLGEISRDAIPVAMRTSRACEGI
ncbi:hypothetical protein DEO72_LG4g1062 [Vigna unguiculata]|uniref:Uncharacterized protein n=1 Tax=Vigna unguiculata TaxID=3917 RepID=A0A4D6LNU4_VIGUN|nr:hypothetical protein DEO72_LG4g1062 [Vigna unguiculata]